MLKTKTDSLLIKTDAGDLVDVVIAQADCAVGHVTMRAGDIYLASDPLVQSQPSLFAPTVPALCIHDSFGV